MLLEKLYEFPSSTVVCKQILPASVNSNHQSTQQSTSRFEINNSTIIECRSQWPRGLMRGSAAARSLGLWVRILPGAWMSVCCEFVCCQVEVSATG